MAYIVDGNNVMGQTPGWHRDKSAARRVLLHKLAGFRRASSIRLTVVFDGAPDASFPDGSVFHGVKVLYAKPGSNADKQIEELVEASKDARGLTVVTSDRQLAFLVRSLGASVMRSGQFRSKMEALRQSVPPIEDGEQADIGDLNSWLRYFGALPEDDDNY